LAQVETCHEPILLKAMTPQEEFQLMHLPELTLPDGYPLRDLPAVVDNSTLPYMRPVFNQDGLCCGQAAGIGYGFTYEIDRERDLDASLTENQYPTHFSWNFMNGGNGWYGVSYLHSFQILKEYGMPDVVDYGGTLSYGGDQRWMSGYPEYFNGMHNRINNAYQIQGGTPEGLQVIKSWLYDHLEGASAGGVCNFYAQYMSASNTLPPGTPEAGKYVLTYFGGSANHAMTIVGYNDSIRWDYNNDGQYTNDIDINGDDVIDMKDWEIGGFKMVQSYGGVPNWGNQGYAYMMYKTIADDIGNGGIWNHCVHVLDVKETCDPKLTARIILKHDWRGKIGVATGLANNSAASTPEISFVYPIFDFQCSNQYMQGGNSEADKTIEFGLDLSEMLSYVELYQDVKIFLNVIEKDPLNQGTGEVIHFSIYDHTAGGTEITSPLSNVPINENDTTTLTIIHSFDFDRVHIVDESLPPAPPGVLFSHQLTASGGTPPYTWELDKSYEEYNSTGVFPNVSAVQLYPTSNNNGWASQAIDFDFPFYDSSYNEITVHVDGYLMFDEQLSPYPYFMDDKVLFKITRNISPLMNHHQNIVTSADQGLFYEGDTASATFRWKTCLESNTSEVLNYAVTLYPDGSIEFYYGNNTPTDEFLWLAGTSEGDNYNHQQTVISNKPSIPDNHKTELQRYTYPPEISLSEDGTLSGTPLYPYNAEEITCKVTDNNFISSSKSLQLHGNGIVVLDSISSGGNQVIEFGETALQSVELLNCTQQVVYDASMTIHIDDDYITVTDSTLYLDSIPVGLPMLCTDAFTFEVSVDIPDHHLIEIETKITSDTNNWLNTITHYAYAPVLAIDDVLVDDENQRLDPGDTCDLVITVLNTGGAAVPSFQAMLYTDDPAVNILLGSVSLAAFPPYSSQEITYIISVDEDVLNGQIIEFHMNMLGENSFFASDTFSLAVGIYQENFETGDFNQFAWGSRGHREWVIDPTIAYEGTFSAKSGAITHDEESSLILDFMAQQEGVVSFYSMVSCEDDTTAANNYDYLAFFVDGAELGRWDGQTSWEYHEYNVGQGYHRLEWKYQKDNSTNTGYDAAWIDLISLPTPAFSGPSLTVDPNAIEVTLKPGETDYDTLYLNNSGPGDIAFGIDLGGNEPGRQLKFNGKQTEPENPELAVESQSSSGRSMAGSTLVSDDEKVHTDKTYTWELRTYCASPDNEWTRDIYLDFPLGIELTDASDFEGGSGGPLLFEGPYGNGVTSHWHGEDNNGWGVIHGGEIATTEITFHTHNNLPEYPVILYEIQGDEYGADPHTITGEIILRNYGPAVGWISLETSEGTIDGGTTLPIEVTIHSEGLEDGQYHAWIIISDDHFNEFVIPVLLNVDTYLELDEASKNTTEFRAYPNPFNDGTNISFIAEEETRGTFILTDAAGMLIFSSSYNLIKGYNRIYWDGRNGQSQPVAAGVYFGKLLAGESVYHVKIVKSNF
jgi:hypothetical protein